MTTATPPLKATPGSNAPAPYTGFGRLFIGGRWVTGGSQRILQPINQYRQTVLLEIPAADKRDVEDAYQEAQRAQVTWAEALPSERSLVMRRAAEIMDARREEIISWSIREAGSPRKKAMLEWKAAHDVTEQAISAPYAAEGRILPSDIRGKESRVYRRPVGVVAVVSPWDFALNSRESLGRPCPGTGKRGRTETTLQYSRHGWSDLCQNLRGSRTPTRCASALWQVQPARSGMPS